MVLFNIFRGRLPKPNRAGNPRPGYRKLAGTLNLRLEPLETRLLLTATVATADYGPDLSQKPVLPLVAAMGGSSSAVGLTPSYISHFYGFDQIPSANGVGQTIAIVDEDIVPIPALTAELLQFDHKFLPGLPDPSLTITAMPGAEIWEPSQVSKFNLGEEIALDVEWAHAMAPAAKIWLVETAENLGALLDGVSYAAAQPGVSVVSMSWGQPDPVYFLAPLGGDPFEQPPSIDGFFTTPAGHPNVAFVAASGDSGVPDFPASSQYVLAVGGTTISTSAMTEIPWKDDNGATGGGYSADESAGPWQNPAVSHVVDYAPFNGRRMVPDVSFNAGNPVAVVDSYDFGTAAPFITEEGTSASAPAWAALIAIADQERASVGLAPLANPAPDLYAMQPSAFNDVTSGTNGTYQAGPGYDLATGLGTPNVPDIVAGLSGVLATPVPLSPPNGTLLTTNTPTLQWTAVTGAVTYMLQVYDATTNTYSTPLGTNASANVSLFTINTQTSSVSFTFPSNLAEGHAYLWEVWAVSAINGWTEPSSGWQSFIVDPFLPPTPIGPSGVVATYTPTFQWSAVSGAAGYQLQISDVTTHTVFPGAPIHVTGTTYTPSIPLNNGDSYVWSVEGLDSAGEVGLTNIAPISFSINAPPIAAPSIVTPNGGSLTATPTLQWQPVAGAAYYGVILVDETAPSVPLFENLHVTGTSYTPPTSLPTGREYQWSVWADVNAGNAIVTGAASPAQFFTVPFAGQPSPLFPLAGSTVNTTSPMLQWSSISGAASYLLSLTDVTSGTTPFGSLQVFGTSFTPSAPLVPGHSYSWSVLAIGEASAGDPGGPYHFTVAATATGTTMGAPTPTWPANNFVVVLATQTFQWTSVSGAAGYNLYIKNLTNGMTTVASQISGTTYVTPITFANNVWVVGNAYQWWVEAYDSTGDVSAASTALNFAFGIGASALTSPVDGGTVTSSMPTLQWSAALVATGYFVSLTDSTTGQSVFSQIAVATAQYVVNVPLTNAHSYLVTITPENSSFTGQPSSFTFSVSATGQNTLNAPIPSGVTGPISLATPTLQWSAVTGATSYGLFVEDATLREMEFPPKVVAGTSFSFASPALPLTNTHTYIWWVEAFNASGDASPASLPMNFNVTTPGTGVGTPTAVSPAGTTTTLVPTFQWTAVTGANGYYLTIIDKTHNVAIVSNLGPIVGTSTVVNVPLTSGDSYQWYVSAWKNTGVLGLAATQSFTVSAASLGVPTLTSPTGGVTSVTPTLSWSPVTGASGYLVSLVDDTVFDTFASSNSIAALIPVSGTTYTPPSHLTGGHTYSWSVSAAFTINGVPVQGPVSSSAVFSVSPEPIPTLSGPSGTVNTVTPSFQWTSVPGATYYGLVLVDSTGGTSGQQALLAGNLTSGTASLPLFMNGTSYSPLMPLKNGDTYQWYVQAYDDNGDVSQSSQPLSFTVSAPTLAVPTLVDPSGNATTTTPTFQWSAVSGATGYTFYLNNSTTGAMAINGLQVVGTSYSGVTLDNGSTYQWWVTASDAVGDSSPTPQPQSFTVTASSLGTPQPIAPGGTVSLTPTFVWVPVAGADGYYLTVVDTTTDTTVGNSIQVLDTDYTMNTPLVDGDAYNWEVQAYSNSGIQGAPSVPVTFAVDVPPQVDPTGTGSAAGYSATWTGHGPVNIADALHALVVDADSANLNYLAATLISPQDGDVLTANTSGTMISASFANGTLTLTGVDTAAHYQQVLRSLQYDNTLGNESAGSEVVALVANDGTLTSAVAASTITLDMAPPVVNLNGSSGTFTVKGTAGSDTPVLIAAAATVTDSDSPNLAFVTVTLPGFQTGDVLSVSAGGLAGGMSAVYTPGNGTLTISGSFSPAQYTTALQQVTYSNTTTLGPGVTSETYSVVANDGSLNSSTVTGTVNIDISVTNNLLFYKGSTGYDVVPAGHPWVTNAFSDDNAVAIDKTAYIAGSGAATFANISSYTLGINGLMIDVAGAHNTFTSSDFILRTGNNNTPNLWTTIPTASITITTRSGATGTGHLSGTDRIEITMANLLVKNKWLEVIFEGADRGDSNTLLATSDVFFFANALGDDGVGETTSFITDPADVLGARSNPKGTINNIPITNIYDYDRSRTVDPADVLIARNNPDGSISAPKALNITGSLAPDTGGGGASSAAAVAGDSGISSGLADSASASSAPKVPTWLANRLANVDLNSGRIATFFEDLAAKDTPKARKILIAADEVADSLGLDDDLLDSLVAGLGQS